MSEIWKVGNCIAECLGELPPGKQAQAVMLAFARHYGSEETKEGDTLRELQGLIDERLHSI